MRFLYYLKVALVSIEALIITVMLLLFFFFIVEVNALAKSLSFNEELIKFLMLLPVGVVVWVFNQSRELVFSDAQQAKVIVNWPDYWQLKVHINISIIYAIIFCVFAILPWISKLGLSTGTGLILFTGSLFGTLVVAASIYFAKISINELFLFENS
ncbi:hypothetical protein [uncultured Deefgea sp.]|uniref:hypothetical protein n=1 Tax=uncultured Deefgea sp. TaxID=1304914 RepID=UPI002591A5D9|nr:hypothetical protein [uncultured Deefgea sp.]